MKVGPVFFVAALPVVAQAQSQASLGVGVGTVRYAGGSSFSAATLSPAAQRLSPSFYFGASGSLSNLPDGVWAAQGRADVWAALSRDSAASLRPALSAGGAASTRSDGLSSAAAYAIGELLLAGSRGGAAFGAGPAGGVIEAEPGVTALRLRGRAWWQESGAQLAVSLEPTRFLGAWYTDVLGSATWDRERVVLSLWVTGRLSATYGSRGAAGAALQYFVAPTLSLEAAAGSYLSDPFQGLPRAGYLTAGVRFHQAARPGAAAPAAGRRLAPLIANRRGDSVVVRFRMDGARSVAIAGDWNGWRPAPLQPLGGAIWEAALLLPRGTYHFSLLVDGTDWVVPGGVALVPDGMGGMVAVLTVL